MKNIIVKLLSGIIVVSTLISLPLFAFMLYFPHARLYDEALNLGDFDIQSNLSFEEIEGIKTEVVSVANGLTKAIANKLNELNNDANSLVPLYIRKSQAEEGR